MKDIMEAIAEEMEMTTGERNYELDRQIGHSNDEELLELLAEFGF
jgi:hypothetical protein